MAGYCAEHSNQIIIISWLLPANYIFICCRTWIAHVLHANKNNRKGQVMEGEKITWSEGVYLLSLAMAWGCKKIMVAAVAVTVLRLPCVEAQASVFLYLLLFWLLFLATVFVSFSLSLCLLSFRFVLLLFSSCPLLSYVSFSFLSQWRKDERKPHSVLLCSALFSPLSFSSFLFFFSLFLSSLFCPPSLGQ